MNKKDLFPYSGEFAELKIGNKTFQLPIVVGSENEKAIDISNLREETGFITIDIGYKNTGSTTSNITYLDGEQGILRYRGYSIEDLAENSTFLEVAYLLIFGELPTSTELSNFENRIARHYLVHEKIRKFFDGYPSKSHPMGELTSLISSLSAFYPEMMKPIQTKEEEELNSIRLLAKMPTIVAWIYKNAIGHPLNYPKQNLDYVSNFLQMTFATKSIDYEFDPVLVSAMNKLLILHADHEQNCSTTSIRTIASSETNIFASAASAISALWGHLHGGANQKVIEMLEAIQQDGGNIQKWIDKAKDKNDSFRLMGFGHRVYKNFDPRAKIIKSTCYEVLSKLKKTDPILDIALKLEEMALKDQYFIDHKLYPNVDFYSGIIYRAMGFPPDMFTAVFALGRLPGWIANWKEMREQKQPIARPRQIYTGKNIRKYVPIENR